MLRFSFGLEVKTHPEIAGLKLKTKKQKKALRFVLGNIWKHGTKPIYLRLRNERNLPKTYNPSGIGNKVLKGVLSALSDSGLIHLKKGVHQYCWTEDDERKPPKLSAILASQELVNLLRKTIPSVEVLEAEPTYIVFKCADKKKNHLLDYQWCNFTRRIHREMDEYCRYMQKQVLTHDGEPLDTYHVIRTFRDWAKDGSFLFGGRAWHSVMGIKKEDRPRIKINDQKTVALDYPASGPNILYLMMTGSRLSPAGDPYDVDGIERDAVKQYLTIMANTPNKYAAAGAISKWLTKGKERSEAKPAARAAEKKFGSKEAVINAILERNKPIAKCLMKGKAMGQHYQWLEANLVFHVAHQLSLRDVPAITVHDEFIVMQKDKDIAEELMYNEWPKALPTLDKAPWYTIK